MDDDSDDSDWKEEKFSYQNKHKDSDNQTEIVDDISHVQKQQDRQICDGKLQ